MPTTAHSKKKYNVTLFHIIFFICLCFLFFLWLLLLKMQMQMQDDYLTLPCFACAVFDDSSAFSAVSQLLNVRVDKLTHDWELRRHFI